MIKISKKNNKKTRFFEHSKVLNTILIILAFSLVISFLVRLNFTKKEEAHVHTFSEIWFCNSIAHWRDATCEHKEQKIDYSEHIGTSDDCRCDICGYTEHTGMSSDCQCDVCGYVEHVGMSDDCKCDVCDYIEHTGMTDDCECDVCGYVEHSYSSLYSYNRDYHWYSATCSHTTEKTGYALHEYDENNCCIYCKKDAPIELPIIPA